MHTFHNHGFEVLLDIPLEDIGYPRVACEKNAIFAHFKDNEIKKSMSGYYRSIHLAKGAITYQGSLITTDSRIVALMLDFLQRKNLYFIDDKPIESSKAYMYAQHNLIPSYEQSIKVNKQTYKNFDSEANILKELKKSTRSPLVITFDNPTDEAFELLTSFIKVIDENQFEIVKGTSLQRN